MAKNMYYYVTFKSYLMYIARAVEAQKLLTHFNGFIKPGVPLSSVFNDKDQVSLCVIYSWCSYMFTFF